MDTQSTDPNRSKPMSSYVAWIITACFCIAIAAIFLINPKTKSTNPVNHEVALVKEMTDHQAQLAEMKMKIDFAYVNSYIIGYIDAQRDSTNRLLERIGENANMLDFISKHGSPLLTPQQIVKIKYMRDKKFNTIH